MKKMLYQHKNEKLILEQRIIELNQDLTASHLNMTGAKNSLMILNTASQNQNDLNQSRGGISNLQESQHIEKFNLHPQLDEDFQSQNRSFINS